MPCTRCGSKINPGKSFCGSCGLPIALSDNETTVVPVESKSHDNSAEVSAAQALRQDGTDLFENEGHFAKPKEQKPKRSSIGVWLSAGVLVLVMLAAVSIWYLPVFVHSRAIPKPNQNAETWSPPSDMSSKAFQSDGNPAKFSESAPAPSGIAIARISGGWESGNDPVASEIEKALFKSNICVAEPNGADPTFFGTDTDMSAGYVANKVRICWNHSDAAQNVVCPAEFYITAAGTNNLGKRSLYYESGFSLALFYDKNWSIELSPEGVPSDVASTVNKCNPYVQMLARAMGGHLTVLGQYK
jgi:hypothetical protein